jgi:hypothetical protein
MFVVYLNIASFVVAAPMAFYDSDKNRDGHLDYDRQQSSHIGMITSLTAKNRNLDGRVGTFIVKSVPNSDYFSVSDHRISE